MVFIFQNNPQTVFNEPQFWVMAGVVLTLLINTAVIFIKRRTDKKDAAEQRALDKKDAAEQLALDKEERKEQEIAANTARENLARQIKAELDLQHEREQFEREKSASTVIKKIEEHDSILVDTRQKVIEATIESKHEIKEAIKEVEAKASQAYDVANTINHKLVEMSEAGLLNQKQEEQKDEVEPAKENES